MANSWQFFKLQQIDSENVDLVEKESLLDSGESLLSKINQLEDKVKENSNLINQNQGKIKNFELEVQSLESQRKKFEEKLYGGLSSNPKELEDWQKEIDQLKNQQTKVEDKILEILEVSEVLESNSINLQKEQDSIKKQYQEVHRNYLEQKNNIKKRLEALIKRRKSITESMKQEELDEYEDLKAKKDGVAIVEIQGDICGGCYMNLPESIIKKAKGRRTTFCVNCGRMLYYEE